MVEKIIVKTCGLVAKTLESVAEMATNSISLYFQYEHEMPKCLKK